MKKRRRLLGLATVVLLLCTMIPMAALAEDGYLQGTTPAAVETPMSPEETTEADPEATGTDSENTEAANEEAAKLNTETSSAETPWDEAQTLTADAKDKTKITVKADQPGVYAVYTVKGGHKVTFNVSEGPDSTNETTITRTIGATKIGRLAPAPANARKPTNPSDLDKFVPAPKPPEGATFVGWSTSKTARELFDVHQTEINTSVELYAWFETGVVKVGTELELRSVVGYSTAPITVELTEDINLTDPLKKNTNADPDIYPAMNPDTQYAGYRQALLIAPGQDVTLTGNHRIAATVTADSGNTVLVRGKFTLDGPTITQDDTEGTIYGIETNVSVNDPKDTPTPTVILKSGNIHGVYMGIHVSNGHLEMEDGNIYNNGNGLKKSIGQGGGICVAGSETYAATAIISGGNIYNNTANNGGGVSVSGGKLASLTVSGGSIHDNHAAAYPVNGIIFGGDGGGISVANPASSLTITGGDIYNNEADRYGGGVYSDWYAAHSMDISGGKIYENKAEYGGGLFSAKAPLNVSGGEIYQNDAPYGGGIYGKVVNISDNAKIYENTATLGGGISTFSASELTMSGGEIYDNSATYGAGLFVNNDSNLTMSSGTVYDNIAATYGGGMYLNNADATVSGGTISGNTAAGSGGGVLIAPEGSFAMSAGTFDGNTAGFGGGIYNVGTVDLTGGKITNNSATNPADGEDASGGGIYTESYENLTVGEDVEFSGNTANKLTSLLESDEEFPIYKENIKVPDGNWSVADVKYGYNNYDINFLGRVENEVVTPPAVTPPAVTPPTTPEVQGQVDEPEVLGEESEPQAQGQVDEPEVLGEEAATGDETNINWILILALVALVGGVVIFTLKRRNEHSRQ